MSDARIDDPFGRPTIMPMEEEYLLVYGVLGPVKLKSLAVNIAEKPWSQS